MKKIHDDMDPPEFSMQFLLIPMTPLWIGSGLLESPSHWLDIQKQLETLSEMTKRLASLERDIASNNIKKRIDENILQEHLQLKQQFNEILKSKIKPLSSNVAALIGGYQWLVDGAKVELQKVLSRSLPDAKAVVEGIKQNQTMFMKMHNKLYEDFFEIVSEEKFPEGRKMLEGMKKLASEEVEKFYKGACRLFSQENEPLLLPGGATSLSGTEYFLKAKQLNSRWAKSASRFDVILSKPEIPTLQGLVQSDISSLDVRSATPPIDPSDISIAENNEFTLPETASMPMPERSIAARNSDKKTKALKAVGGSFQSEGESLPSVPPIDLPDIQVRIAPLAGSRRKKSEQERKVNQPSPSLPEKELLVESVESQTPNYRSKLISNAASQFIASEVDRLKEMQLNIQGVPAFQLSSVLREAIVALATKLQSLQRMPHVETEPALKTAVGELIMKLQAEKEAISGKMSADEVSEKFSEIKRKYSEGLEGLFKIMYEKQEYRPQ